LSNITIPSIIEISRKLYEERENIIDLFCKTFIISQEPKSSEEIRMLIEITELECKMGDDFSQTFRLKLKDS
jgi:hypothetical protein